MQMHGTLASIPASGSAYPREVPDRDISEAELARHVTPADIWIALYGVVYDVTSWLHTHPGGPNEFLERAGQDATEAFSRIHEREVIERIGLGALAVGRYTGTTTVAPLVVEAEAGSQYQGIPSFHAASSKPREKWVVAGAASVETALPQFSALPDALRSLL